MDEEDVAPRGKAGFGAFQGGRQKKTEFPHRHHDEGDAQDPGHAPGQGNTGGQKNTGARGLRSPLLGGGGGGDDSYDDDAPRGGKARPMKPGKLRSPILGGGSGGDDYYDDEVFEEEELQEINDPTVLRSPLLAVRTPRAHHPQNQATTNNQPPQPAQRPMAAPEPAQAQANMQAPDGKSAPFVQGPYSQASTGNAPNFALAGGPAMPQAPVQVTQADPAFRGGPNYQPFPPNQSAQAAVGAPQAPSQQPAYSPPPAPAAPPGFGQKSNQAGASAPVAVAVAPAQDPYAYGLASNLASNLAGNPTEPMPSADPTPSAQQPSSNYQAPLPPAPSAAAPRPNQPALPPNPSSVSPSSSATALPSMPKTPGEIPTPNTAKAGSAKATGTKFDAADSGEVEAIKHRGMRGSKLLGDVTDDPVGPMDRRSRFNDRRTTPRGSDRRGGSASSLADDDDHDREPVQTLRGGSHANLSGGGASAAPNPMAPLLMIAALIGIIIKGLYISSFKMDELMHNLPATIDQVWGIVVLLAIVLFAVKAQSR
jgi:hypothetical protein